jgi:hypothetical protein
MSIARDNVDVLRELQATGLPLDSLATIAASTILGNNTGGAGVPLALTLAQVRTLLALTSSNVSDFSEAVDDRVAALLTAGTGITLTYNDAGNTLTVALSAASTPALILLDTKTASASATLDFTSSINSTYDEYVFELVDLVPATNAVQLLMRTSTNAGSSFDAGANDYAYGLTVLASTTGATAVVSSGAGASSIALTTTGAIGNASTDSVSGRVTIYGPSGASRYKKILVQTMANTAADGYTATGCAYRVAAADIDAVRFLMSSGNIASGAIRMYGVRKA